MKLQAIVIKSSDRKEKDKNILLFSIEQGKIWATLKGVKNAKAKMKMAQNPFCFGEFILEEGKSGFIVTGFETIESFFEISQNINAYFEATAILEVLNVAEFSSTSERARVFVLTLNSLKTLCFSKVLPLYVLNKFFIEFFQIFGVGINTEKCACCSNKIFDKLYYNNVIGELVCANCKNLTSVELSNATFSALKILTKTDFSKLKTLSLAKGSEKELLTILVKNFELRFNKRLKLMGILS